MGKSGKPILILIDLPKNPNFRCFISNQHNIPDATGHAGRKEVWKGYKYFDFI